jgi:hypothetical protein
LNFLDKKSNNTIDIIEIFNPRMGYIWSSIVTDLIHAVTDYPIDDCFDLMRKYLIELSYEIIV